LTGKWFFKDKAFSQKKYPTHKNENKNSRNMSAFQNSCAPPDDADMPGERGAQQRAVAVPRLPPTIMAACHRIF
jgi:hypothetical protein